MENINTTKKTKSPVSTFEELYAKKDFKAGINVLLQNKQQFSSGTFHYNLGTTYAKLGDMGAARYHLEKAINLGMYNSTSINNLNFVRSKIESEDISTSSALTDKFIDFSLSFPHEAYISLSLGLLILFLGIARYKKINSKFKLGFITFLSLVPVLFSFIYLQNINSAVAMKDIALYEGPSRIFQEKGKLNAGAKIILGEYKDGWFLVKYPTSLSGWINKDNLGIL